MADLTLDKSNEENWEAAVKHMEEFVADWNTRYPHYSMVIGLLGPFSLATHASTDMHPGNMIQLLETLKLDTYIKWNHS